MLLAGDGFSRTQNGNNNAYGKSVQNVIIPVNKVHQFCFALNGQSLFLSFLKIYGPLQEKVLL